MRMKKPYIATLDQVKISREDEYGIIEYIEPNVSSVRLKIGPEVPEMSDEEILDCHNRVLEAQQQAALEYLRPVDYYLGNPPALLAERKRKLREAAARRKEVNRGKKEIRLVNVAPELGRSERGAEAIAEART